MTLMNQKKKKKTAIIISISGVMVLFMAAVICMFLDKTEDKGLVTEDASEITTGYQEETTVKILLEDTEKYEKDCREYYIDYVVLADNQDIDGYLDIRIRFPNGEDYIVASGKTITRQAEGGFYMLLNEREIHMLSSARTDMDVYEGTTIYLSAYKSEQCEVSVEDYPWNQFVISSFGVSDSNAEDIYSRRIQLEENLLTFMNQTLQK